MALWLYYMFDVQFFFHCLDFLLQTSHLELLHGFVDCLEVEEPEQAMERTILLPEDQGQV